MISIHFLQLGVNGYSFAVNNNGYVLYHPDLRPMVSYELLNAFNKQYYVKQYCNIFQHWFHCLIYDWNHVRTFYFLKILIVPLYLIKCFTVCRHDTSTCLRILIISPNQQHYVCYSKRCISLFWSILWSYNTKTTICFPSPLNHDTTNISLFVHSRSLELNG